MHLYINIYIYIIRHVILYLHVIPMELYFRIKIIFTFTGKA